MKDSIKREQSQASLSFAERKNFRPKVKKNKLLLLLVLLLTAVTGAWADGQELKVKIISEEMATPWLQDGGTTMLAKKDLPDFYPVTEDEAMAWADVPQDGTVFLIYAFDDPDEGSAVHYVRFDNGEYTESYQQDESIYSIAYIITDQGVKFYYTYAFSAKLAANTKDAKNWTIASGENSVAGNVEAGLTGLSEGDAVTLTYTGHLKLKGIKAATDARPAPLTIEAITPGTIVVDIDGTLSKGMKYSVNGGTKTLIKTTTPIEGLKAGDKVQFYGNGTQTQVYGGYTEVSILGIGDGFKTKVYGNIMSLLDEEGFATKTDLPNAQNVFYGLFKGNTTLIDASELLLPATTLAERCYSFMFTGCTSLTTAPKLPATTLAYQCYYSMFLSCTSLTNAYVKAAFTAGNAECNGMFEDCSAAGATLHTTPGSKASWEAKMGPDNDWENWSVADDWQE
jgi:hypothetical protein